jgi:deazaflavin-dependent oxidoreductase (nitroreductase family)
MTPGRASPPSSTASWGRHWAGLNDPTHRRREAQTVLLRRVVDKMLTRMIRRGRGPEFLQLLTVVGRKTGEAHCTPVAPVIHYEGAWLVSPYGQVNWVRSLRASRQAVLSRGDKHTNYRAREVDPVAAVPILRQYLSVPSERFVRKDFDVNARSTDQAIASAAAKHPVFELTPLP